MSFLLEREEEEHVIAKSLKQAESPYMCTINMIYILYLHDLRLHVKLLSLLGKAYLHRMVLNTSRHEELPFYSAIHTCLSNRSEYPCDQTLEVATLWVMYDFFPTDNCHSNATFYIFFQKQFHPHSSYNLTRHAIYGRFCLHHSKNRQLTLVLHNKWCHLGSEYIVLWYLYPYLYKVEWKINETYLPVTATS